MNWPWTIWRARRLEKINDLVKAAFGEQLIWEASHDVPYTPDQRRMAVVQRAICLLAKERLKPPRGIEAMVSEIDRRHSERSTIRMSQEELQKMVQDELAKSGKMASSEKTVDPARTP